MNTKWKQQENKKHNGIIHKKTMHTVENNRYALSFYELYVIVKTCSDKFYTIRQTNCPMLAAKIRNYFHSHNLMKP